MSTRREPGFESPLSDRKIVIRKFYVCMYVFIKTSDPSMRRTIRYLTKKRVNCYITPLENFSEE